MERWNVIGRDWLGDGWTKVNADFRRLNADCRRFTHHRFEICEIWSQSAAIIVPDSRHLELGRSTLPRRREELNLEYRGKKRLCKATIEIVVEHDHMRSLQREHHVVLHVRVGGEIV